MLKKPEFSAGPMAVIGLNSLPNSKLTILLFQSKFFFFKIMFSLYLNEISGGYEKIEPVSESF